jgi:hypothetical protein
VEGGGEAPVQSDWSAFLPRYTPQYAAERVASMANRGPPGAPGAVPRGPMSVGGQQQQQQRWEEDEQDQQAARARLKRPLSEDQAAGQPLPPPQARASMRDDDGVPAAGAGQREGALSMMQPQQGQGQGQGSAAPAFRYFPNAPETRPPFMPGAGGGAPPQPPQQQPGMVGARSMWGMDPRGPPGNIGPPPPPSGDVESQLSWILRSAPGGGPRPDGDRGGDHATNNNSNSTRGPGRPD